MSFCPAKRVPLKCSSTNTCCFYIPLEVGIQILVWMEIALHLILIPSRYLLQVNHEETPAELEWYVFATMLMLTIYTSLKTLLGVVLLVGVYKKRKQCLHVWLHLDVVVTMVAFGGCTEVLTRDFTVVGLTEELLYFFFQIYLFVGVHGYYSLMKIREQIQVNSLFLHSMLRRV